VASCLVAIAGCATSTGDRTPDQGQQPGCTTPACSGGQTQPDSGTPPTPEGGTAHDGGVDSSAPPGSDASTGDGGMSNRTLYRDYGAFPTMHGGSRVLSQSLLEWEGHVSWGRECPMLASGIDWASCTPWGSVDLTNARGVGNEQYSGYGAFALLDSSPDRVPYAVVQSLVNYDGKTGWARQCPIDPQNDVQWNSCSPWGQVDLSNLRGVGGESYRAYGAYNFKLQTGGEWITQSVIAMDGKSGWARSCPVDPVNGVLWASCQAWSPPLDLTNLRGVGGESYTAYGSFEYTLNGSQELSQSVIAMDGVSGWARSCPVDGTNGVEWASCTTWGLVDLTGQTH
jgi:hypothetical protein